MTTCLDCRCAHPSPAACSGRLLVRTEVRHTLAILRSGLRDAGVEWTEPVPGLLDASSEEPGKVLAALAGRLSSIEATEVRVADVGGLDAAEQLGAALAAPTLAQATARVAHAELVELLEDEGRRFRAVYQPIVELAEPSRTVGYEALLRASGPEGTLGAPALFGAAEQAGWLNVLDRVGRTTALRDAAGWLGERTLFVNFLPTTIYRPEVCLRTTEAAAERAGIALDRLVFEVTESERITDVDHLERVFAYYRDRGCRVALDDLGSGYASLDLLVRLRPDVVKLDGSIVTRLPEPAATTVVAAVTDIVHAYGGVVLAECVETAVQAEAATALGVDLGQGWLFGRPVERAQLAAPGLAAPELAAPELGAAEMGAAEMGAAELAESAPGR